MGLLLDMGKKWFLEFPGKLPLLRDSSWQKQRWIQAQIVCTPCLWQWLGLWHGNGNGNERQGKVPSFNPPCHCRSALRASAKVQRPHRLCVLCSCGTLKLVSEPSVRISQFHKVGKVINYWWQWNKTIRIDKTIIETIFQILWKITFFQCLKVAPLFAP